MNGPGIACLCEADGHIAAVLHNRAGLGDRLRPGRCLVAALDPDCRAKGRNFLAAVGDEHAAFDWLLHFAADDRQRLVSLHMAGIATADGLLLAGGPAGADTIRLLAAFAAQYRPEAEAMAAVLRRWSERLGGHEQDSGRRYDELSRLNNELITAQRRLAKQKAELEFLNAEKTRFLGMLAHDLRHPLQVILAYGDLLGESKGQLLDAKRIGMIDTMRRSGEFMQKLMDDLLDVTVIEAGKLALNCAPTDLNRLIAENIGLSRVLAEAARIQISYVEQARFPGLMLDRAKIDQVLNNLIGNALKVSGPGSTIRVELSGSGDEALLAIADEGPGLPPDEVEAIFQPFRRGSVAATSSGKGAGLGLAIARGIVRAHGGRLWAQNNAPAAGASFFIALPRGPGRT